MNRLILYYSGISSSSGSNDISGSSGSNGSSSIIGSSGSSGRNVFAVKLVASGVDSSKEYVFWSIS